VADWALLKQPIFAATTLCQADVARVATTVDLWADSLPRPDVLVGLAAAASVIRQRVCHCGRDMETGLTRHAPRPAVEVVRGRVRGLGPAADPGGRQHLQHVRRQPRPRAGRPGAPAPDPLGDAMAQPALDVGRDATTAGPLCRRLLITGPGQVAPGTASVASTSTGLAGTFRSRPATSRSLESARSVRGSPACRSAT
jgi:hypothetical protein